MAAPDLTADVAVLEARTAVHEALLLALLVSLYRETERWHEKVEAVMLSVTRQFRRAAREAPETERHQAEVAVLVLEQLTEKLLNNIPHVSKH